MELLEAMKMTREERLNEVGKESPCPFCQRPRVARSSYTRCNRCGINWLDEEMHLPNYLSLDPRIARLGRVATVDEAKPTVDSPAALADLIF